MEEVIAVLIQLILEIAFQVFVSGGVDLATSRRDHSGCGWLAGHGLLGCVCGWLSTLLFPRLMLPFLWLRIVNMVATPFLAGGLTLLLDRQWNRGRDGANAFWHGFTFALLFGLARFAFGAR